MRYLSYKPIKQSILLSYIKLNNIIVTSTKKKYAPQEVLVLLPHCLQNSNCNYKVAGFTSNCRRCYKCEIGKINEIAEKHNITNVEVVTGGTMARSIVKKIRPKLIIAIACERDLASGIFDIKVIPTYGILNNQPNGPCHNTSIDINEFEETLNLFTK